MSILGFATMCQLITLFFPGRNQTMYYICVGHMPVAMLNEPIKANRSLNIVLSFTSIVHILFNIRTVIDKILKKNTAQQTPTVQQFLKKKFKKEAIFR